MKLVDELAPDILASDGFKCDFNQLMANNLLIELKQSGATAHHTDLDTAALIRLLQSAMILADCTDGHSREIAQRISTATLRLAGLVDDGVRDVFFLIQGRLRNYPTLASLGTKATVPKHAPLALQYEFIEARNQQTVQVGDESEYVLTSFQLESWHKLLGGHSTTLTGPTSAGKSYILLLHIVEQFRIGRLSSIAYIVPTRALINQVSDDALKELSRRGVCDVHVTTVPVDMGMDGSAKTLYVFTQERLDALLISSTGVNLDLVVIDEAQMISSGTRGVLLESVIDRIYSRSPAAQFVFSGPMIENPDYFGKVFGLDNFSPCSTRQSPVTQNLIFLDYHSQPTSHISVRLNGQNVTKTIATIQLPFCLQTDTDKLSYLSFLFGRSGSSVVYASGKADAEKIAIKLAQEVADDSATKADLNELISFVKRHVHKDYALVGTLEKGVGFHYGHMPSLLRKTLEDYFKARRLSFLVCTSTLLYGLNLPAKNIFLLKPTKGRSSAISGPDFWNLAGRAGRLGKELEGNVFLIDYTSWENKPLGEARDIEVTSALKSAIVDHSEQLVTFLNDPEVSSGKSPELEIALGKLVLDHRIGRLDRTISRYRSGTNAPALKEITDNVERISIEIDLPLEVVNKNIGISLFRQKDLLDYFVKRLKKLPPEELIPAHPLGDFTAVHSNYIRAFKRIHTYLLRYPGGDKRHYFFSGLSLRWMRGDSLPILISSAIKYNRDKNTKKSTASIIRETMEHIEEHLRFRYVKFFTCYNSVLEVALKQADLDAYVANIPNIPLFLEMGGSSGAMINLMALGLSRTTAEVLTEYITDKDMTIDQLRKWIRMQNFKHLDISVICTSEIDALIQKLKI